MQHPPKPLLTSCADTLLACRLVLVAVGTLLGGVALRPTTPLTATVVATLIIVGFAMVVDAAYTRGWIPGWVVHATPILLYANGAHHAAAGVCIRGGWFE